MTGSRAAVVTLPADTQILVTRDFDAPRHLVYLAWTTLALIKRWWSADRGRATTADVDLRPGGRENRDRHLEYGDSLQQAIDRLEQAAISAAHSRKGA